jgi:hypothetical protein
MPPEPALDVEYRAINESSGMMIAKFQQVPEFGLPGMKDEVRGRNPAVHQLSNIQ